MRPTSPNRLAVGKAGYSLIEILIVLAIMALMAAISMPRAASALDQVISHTVFFDFQRQVTDLRARAFREERGFNVVGTEASTGGRSRDRERDIAIPLRSGWTYRLGAPFRIGAGAECSPTEVDLFNGKRLIMHLESKASDCRFIRTV